MSSWASLNSSTSAVRVSAGTPDTEYQKSRVTAPPLPVSPVGSDADGSSDDPHADSARAPTARAPTTPRFLISRMVVNPFLI